MKNNTKLNSIGYKALTISIIAVFLGLGMLGGRITSASTSQAYDNVQIFVTPHNSTLDTFSVSAYNSIGGLVATSQSSYPAFSFELPTGMYLFAVTASSSYAYPIYGPIAYGAAQAKSSGLAYPVKYYNPTEYGYVLVNITSSRTINISTVQIQNMSTTKITVSAKYLNGTSAVGAYIDASIVGGGYFYSPDSNIMMSGQTGSDGVVTLQVPSVPLEITAWSWVPVNLPQNETTTKVTIGGEIVNVTVYWQPTYVGLAGSYLIIPPADSANITLKAQQPNYWYFPQGVASQSGSVSPGLQSSGGQYSGAVASSPGGVPANVAGNSPQFSSSSAPTQSVPTQISPLPGTTETKVVTTTATLTAQSSNSTIAIEGGVVVALVISAAGVALALRRK
jgi:hypothetical protein